jgi:hypothetical protein
LDDPYGTRALTGRCEALAVALPAGALFSHVTAARLWPLPLPVAAADEPIHVSVRGENRGPRRSGVVGHELSDPQVRLVRRRDLDLVDPASTFCHLASVLSLHDLVAVGDALVLEPVFASEWEERPWVPFGVLGERVERFRGRGKVLARRAVELIRPGTESRPETLLRLAIVDGGLPEPEVNVDIFDAAGRFIGRGDLVYRRWRVIVEYDGDQHRIDTRQFDRDVHRLEDFAANGWRVVRVVGRSFFRDRQECVNRVARALRDSGWPA